jgi:hypothetical protein
MRIERVSRRLLKGLVGTLVFATMLYPAPLMSPARADGSPVALQPSRRTGSVLVVSKTTTRDDCALYLDGYYCFCSEPTFYGATRSRGCSPFPVAI